MANMQSPERIKFMLQDLGKPTMRGIRRCPKCGTFNGTRGISCKNKNCDVVFKDREKKKGHSADAVKIITGSNVQVFSVRLRDRGPDYRGFVQLPLVQDLDGNPAEGMVDPVVLAQAARCYVDMCSRNSSQAVLNSDPCNHIHAAVTCNDEATPLTLKNSVLNLLQVSNDMKQAIWLLATETTGPLVQRVTKNIMVVKCKPNPKQPLGFLHCAFFETSRNRTHPEFKFTCSCRAFKALKPGILPKEDVTKKCVHFYACICAFASDDKLSEEFSYFINLDSSSWETSTEPKIVTVYSTEGEDTPDAPNIEIIIDEEGNIGTAAKRRKRDDTLVQASSALLTLQDSVNTPKQPSPAKATVVKTQAPTQKKTAAAAIDEASVQVSFQSWISSVTERVNQTMHYQFDGNPEPLVFHAPQVFFDCLQQRISTGSKKKRLPNSTTGFVRRDALPLGTFTKYTWHITNILHVKQIFDTPEMPMDITRNFVENRDGTYDLYEVPKVAVENMDDFGKTKIQPAIRPFELKTYLKVGQTSTEQKEPTPFIIEWIPDILPKSHIGELRIKFEYGHQRNGHIEQRPPSTPQIEMHMAPLQL